MPEGSRGFDGPAADYDRFMGRYSAGLSAPFADFAGVRSGLRVLDVGCGTGALTAELVARLGESSVVGIDPSPSFVQAARERHPGTRIEVAASDALPFPDADFDIALAQLVIHFMQDPVHDLAEMARVTRPGGVVAVCVWDHVGQRSPLSPLWSVLSELEPAAPLETRHRGSRALVVDSLTGAGLGSIRETVLEVRLQMADFQDFWQPFLRGSGPLGAAVSSLTPQRLDSLERALRDRMPTGSFEVVGSAWAATGVVPAVH